MKKLVLLFAFIVSTLVISAQQFRRPGDWKVYRKEVFFTMGTSNFLGDLGGRDQFGIDYSPVDMDLSATKTAFGIGARYKLLKWFNAVGKFNYLLLSGDDAFTKDKYRNNRNLNFKSSVLELSGRFEIGYHSAKGGISNRYSIKKTLGRRMKLNTHSLFIFGGVGTFFFNPKGRNSSGDYVRLRPLHTEGQGLPGGPKQYSNFSFCIPVGAFYKYTVDKQWSFGIEFSWRKTFTDYIDDVSTRYYDPIKLEENYGPLSAAMADPSKGNIYGATMPSGDGTAAQRGDSQYDSYVSLEVTVGYIMKQKRRNRRAKLRSKF